MNLEAYATLAFEAEHAWERAETFAGRPLVPFDPEVGLAQLEPASQAVFFTLEEAGEAHRPGTALDRLLYDLRACEVEALSLSPVVERRYTHPVVIHEAYEVLGAPFLPALRSLYLGDVTTEEYQATWQWQPSPEEALAQLPELEVLRIRGQLQGFPVGLRHERLQALQLQFHAIPRVVEALATADLPRLEMLEVWVGRDDYNDGLTAEHFVPLLSGKVFPSLRWLGLRNAEQGDAVAAVVADSPLLERLEVLDLSLGGVGDAGVEALLAAPGLRSLTRLHLDHHAAQPEPIARLEQVGIPTLTAPPHPRGPRPPDGDSRRYTAVGE